MAALTANNVTGDNDVLYPKLEAIFKQRPEATPGTPVSYSMEVSAKDDFDIGQVEHLSPQPIFCSLPWISDENLRYEDDFRRAPTLRVAEQLLAARYTVVNHVSCYNITKPQVDKLLATGIRNLFVIRGDTVNPEQTFPNSGALVQYLRQQSVGKEEPKHHKLTIGVGGYPYGHHQSPSPTDELRYLREKIDHGVDFLLTQTIYDAQSFFSYRDRCRQAGIHIPIVPGIYLPHSYRHLQAMLNLTRIRMEPMVWAAFEAHAKDTSDQFEAFVVDHFAGVVWELLEPREGSTDPVRLLHFFSFNKFALLQKLLQRVEPFFK